MADGVGSGGDRLRSSASSGQSFGISLDDAEKVLEADDVDELEAGARLRDAQVAAVLLPAMRQEHALGRPERDRPGEREGSPSSRLPELEVGVRVRFFVGG